MDIDRDLCAGVSDEGSGRQPDAHVVVPYFDPGQVVSDVYALGQGIIHLVLEQFKVVINPYYDCTVIHRQGARRLEDAVKDVGFCSYFLL